MKLILVLSLLTLSSTCAQTTNGANPTSPKKVLRLPINIEEFQSEFLKKPQWLEEIGKVLPDTTSKNDDYSGEAKKLKDEWKHMSEESGVQKEDPLKVKDALEKVFKSYKFRIETLLGELKVVDGWLKHKRVFPKTEVELGLLTRYDERLLPSDKSEALSKALRPDSNMFPTPDSNMFPTPDSLEFVSATDTLRSTYEKFIEELKENDRHELRELMKKGDDSVVKLVEALGLEAVEDDFENQIYITLLSVKKEHLPEIAELEKLEPKDIREMVWLWWFIQDLDCARREKYLLRSIGRGGLYLRTKEVSGFMNVAETLAETLAPPWWLPFLPN